MLGRGQVAHQCWSVSSGEIGMQEVPGSSPGASITEHSFHGIPTSSQKGRSVTHVSGTMCYLCVGSLIPLSKRTGSFPAPSIRAVNSHGPIHGPMVIYLWPLAEVVNVRSEDFGAIACVSPCRAE